MNIEMKSNIQKRIFDLNNDFEEYEVAFLATAKVENHKKFAITKIYKQFICDNSQMCVNIDKISQLELIKHCIENKLYPVIIHTHVDNKYKLGFSYPDNAFERSFIKAARVVGYKQEIISILYGKDGYKARILNGYLFRNVEIDHCCKINCLNKKGIKRFIEFTGNKK